MSRYIDAEHLRKWMLARWESTDPYTDRPFRADEILAQIDRELSIDIIRCGECKFSEVIQNDSSGVMARYCRAFTVPMMKSDDDYCSYGERRECRDR